jgi:hypothetical protein
MTIRFDNSIPLNISVDNINNKTELRTFILNQWILENSNSKYRYFVENLANGNRIYLERPGRLNKGCDFIIFIENHILFNNGNDKPPRHDFITDDLAIKKNHLTLAQWTLLLQAIESIYNCQPFQTAFALCNNLPAAGETYELILKTVRWLFIEQDITYWSGQGRNMLYSHILDL